MSLSLSDVHGLYLRMRSELARVVIGQETVLEQIIICLFAGGHILIEGVPGLAKTLAATALGHVVGGHFGRIQFTPDLMPADIIGTTVYNAETNAFQVKRGPVFCQILLADEINRSPAKTQSALLQAMQEKQVTIDGIDYPLGDFFMCLATQNPVEMEGTYPLPEAQIDRFLMKVLIGYPERTQENRILENYRQGFSAQHPEQSGLTQVLGGNEVAEIKQAVSAVIVDDKIIDYITRIVSRTRDYEGIALGSSPRGSVALFQTARVKAVLAGRDFVVPDDIKGLVLPVLRHRLILEPEAEIEGFTQDDCLKKILDECEVPR